MPWLVITIIGLFFDLVKLIFGNAAGYGDDVFGVLFIALEVYCFIVVWSFRFSGILQ